MSPSGKAAGSGPAIRGFESLHPSQDKDTSYFRLTRVFLFFEKHKRADTTAEVSALLLFQLRRICSVGFIETRKTLLSN